MDHEVAASIINHSVDTDVDKSVNQSVNLKQEQTLQSALGAVFTDAKFPDDNTVVTGALSAKKIAAAAAAGIAHIINLQPNDELTFDEAAAVKEYDMHYTHIPIAGAQDLKQLNLLDFDKALRAHQGKKTLMHCKTGNRVGACMALRAGWLRGRKMDTALKTGQQHGLTSLEDEVRTRLLVPR